MFSTVNKYQTAVRLAAKAWMMFVETGSNACKLAFQRMNKLIQKLRVPSGPYRAELWIDVESHHEYLTRVNAAYIACGMPTVVAIAG